MDLGDLQLAIVRALWAHPDASAADVKAALTAEGRTLAPTTVSTVLSRLAKRGLVTHRARGRTFVYRAKVSEDELRRSAVDELARNLFGGDRVAMVSHLLGGADVGEEELALIRERLAGTADEGDEQ